MISQCVGIVPLPLSNQKYKLCSFTEISKDKGAGRAAELRSVGAEGSVEQLSGDSVAGDQCSLLAASPWARHSAPQECAGMLVEQ